MYLWTACYAGVLIWIYLSAAMFVFNAALFGLASCSVLSEKELVGGQPEEEEEKVSMSHRILRLLTSLIHYCWPVIHNGLAGTMPHGSGTNGPIALPFNP